MSSSSVRSTNGITATMSTSSSASSLDTMSERKHKKAKSGWKKVKKSMPKRSEKMQEAHGNWFSNAIGKIFHDGKFDNDPNLHCPYLMEVVSARGLHSNGKRDDAIDPYCIVLVGGKEVHRTKPITKDPDPIWTVLTSSLCIVDIPTKSVEGDDPKHQSVVVQVCHGFQQIGSVTIPFADILDKTGEREEFPIISKHPRKKRKHSNKKQGLLKRAEHEGEGILALRFRKAKDSDYEFFYKTENKPDAIAGDINFRKVAQPPTQSLRLNKKHIDGVEHERVQPGPDPDRPEQETRWMTREAMTDEAMKPSTQWVEAGYGALGKVFLEIIACDDLPNMDLGAANDFTDTFVGIVFEDTMVRTNVIFNDLDPRWMPWSSRAFAFNVRHPSSLLLIGVFDYDLLTEHDPIGRIVIDTGNFESNTSYLLHYNLYQDTHQREAAGTITIRLRIEWESEVEAVKMSFVSPPRFLVNVESKKALDVLRYLCRGPVNMQAASLESVSLYAEELMSYGDVYFYLVDVVWGILLWRGRADLEFGDKKFNIWFPVHSMFVFSMAVLTIETPHNIPPIICFSIAWLLLSLNFHGSRHPSPWKRCKSVDELNRVMIVGHSCHGAVNVAPNESKEASELRDQLDDCKAQRMKGLFFEMVNTGLKVRRVYSKTQVENIAINTEDKAKGWAFIRNYLYYIHLMLFYMCTYLNMVRNIVNWRGYMAHQLTLYSVTLGLAWILLPMDFIACWILRILVWTFLGPGMKLVDIFLFHPIYKTRQELEADPKHGGWHLDSLLESEALERMGEAARLAGEEALKLKDMRSFVFGELSQLIPNADSSRFPCVPLPRSAAQPYVGSDEKGDGFVDIPATRKKWRYIPGQRLEGHMIHRHVQSINKEMATTSQGDDVNTF